MTQALRDAMRAGLDDSHKEKSFDYIVARWLTMFSLDIETFLKSCMACLKDDGNFIIEGSIMTTEGPMMRMQFDEFAYSRLYSPEYLESVFKKLDLVVVSKEKRTPDHMYVYVFDRYPIERHLYLYYEYKMNNKFAKFSADEYEKLEFNAREIRAWSFVLQKGDSWLS